MTSSLCYNERWYDGSGLEVFSVDRRLEEWFRKDDKPLSPEEMGLPVVRGSVPRPSHRASGMSPMDFLGGSIPTEAAGENSILAEEIVPNGENAPDDAVSSGSEPVAPTEEIIPQEEEKSDGPATDSSFPDENTPIIDMDEEKTDVSTLFLEDREEDLAVHSDASKDGEVFLPLSEDDVLFGSMGTAEEKNKFNDPPTDNSKRKKRERPGWKGTALALVAVAGGIALLMKGDSPEETIEKAKALFDGGDFGGAVELYGKIEDKMPLSVPDLICKGEALFSVGRTAEALNSYYEALSVVPDSADIHRRIAETFLVLGSPLQAEKAYTEVVRLSPDHGSLMELSRLKMNRGDFEGALLVLERSDIPVSDDDMEILRREITAKLTPPLSDDLPVSDDFAVVSMDEKEDPSSDVAAISLDVHVRVSHDSGYTPAGKTVVAGKKEAIPLRSPSPRPAASLKPTSVVADETRFERILASGGKISPKDGSALKRLATSPTSDFSLYRLGQMYNRGGRPKEALLFLEKGLAVDGGNRWLLAEAAYSYASIGKDEDAMAMVEHALVRGKRTFPGANPPSVISISPSSEVWNIGWDRSDSIADRVPLYDNRREALIPGLPAPRLDAKRYLPLQNAISMNPQDRSLYVDFMVLWSKSTGNSMGSLAAGALAVESHALFVAGDLLRGREAIDKAISVAPDQPLLVEIKKNLFGSK